MEPVTGLPPQVTIQSTPAPSGSFTGDMETVVLALTSSERDWPPEVLPPVLMTIEPA